MPALTLHPAAMRKEREQGRQTGRGRRLASQARNFILWRWRRCKQEVPPFRSKAGRASAACACAAYPPSSSSSSSFFSSPPLLLAVAVPAAGTGLAGPLRSVPAPCVSPLGYAPLQKPQPGAGPLSPERRLPSGERGERPLRCGSGG